MTQQDEKERDERIVPLGSEEEWKEAYPVMSQLRTHLTMEDYLQGMRAMWREGYRLFAYRKGEEILALAGGTILTNLYNGRHFYLYDLVTAGEYRSQGIGESLLRYVENWAKEQGCEWVVLSSGLQRVDAHRFYEDKMGYMRSSYLFKRRML
ncbi:MAG: GNAT family N-acetyltransferase [Thermicanus sp.]|nr:GNAT family N-acetyltransferase [Thermicanus sp.]